MLRELSELALAHGLADIAKTKPGRLRNLLEKLRSAAAVHIRKIPKYTDEVERVGAKLDEFHAATGWNGKERHVMTYISFLSDLFDGRYPEIHRIIADITEHYERNEPLKPAFFWAGAMAAEKWRSIWQNS